MRLGGVAIIAACFRKAGVLSDKDIVPFTMVDDIRSRHWMEQEKRSIEKEATDESSAV